MRKKRMIVVGITVMVWGLLSSNQVQAALQANATTHANPVSKAGAAWITEIRQMETVGQTMGLTETLEGLNATGDSNNIDVHMMLPNEYEAITILSVSGYGNSGKLRDETDAQKRTTTGNATGVYFTGDRSELLSCYSGRDYGKYSISGDIGTQMIMDLKWHEGSSSATQWNNQNSYNQSGQNTVMVGYEGLFSISRIYGTRGGYGWCDPWAMDTYNPMGWVTCDVNCRGIAVTGI